MACFNLKKAGELTTFPGQNQNYENKPAQKADILNPAFIVRLGNPGEYPAPI